jgi:hypothetical protein
VRDTRYAEGKYPDDGTDDSTQIDMQYGLVVYAGDSFRQDYVVPATVLDVETDGTLITSEGGYVRDDTDLLKSLARVTYEWWNQDRVILTLATTQLTSAIQPGYFIVDVGDSTVPNNGHYMHVNTVVSELRITWPRLEGNQLASPVMEIVTGAGELDPMTLAPKEPKASRGKRRAAR